MSGRDDKSGWKYRGRSASSVTERKKGMGEIGKLRK